MKTFRKLGLVLLISTVVQAQTHGPKEGYVPDAGTAVKIAEAVLTPVYGKQLVESERPFTAKLATDVWTVSGTLHCPDGNAGVTALCEGGVAVVRISKPDARVLSMTHYK